MSVNDETSHPTPKIQIGASSSPNPPWTNVVFVCEGQDDKCGATYQLGVSDELKPHPQIDGVYLAPPCWTCGHVNLIEIADPPKSSRNGAPTK